MGIFDIFRKKELGRPIDPGFVLEWRQYGWAVYPTNQKSFITNGYKGNATIHSIISKCADKFASVPFYLYRVRDAKKAKHYARITKGKNAQLTTASLHQRLKLKNEAFEEVEGGAVYDLLERPNPSQTDSDFKSMVIKMRMTTGAAPIYANMGVSGQRVQSLYCLPTNFVQLYPDPSLMHIAKAELNIGGIPTDLPIEQLYYWKYSDIEIDSAGRHLYGLSPLQAALIDLQANTENVKRQAFMMKNQGATGVFTPKDLEAMRGVSSGPAGVDGLRSTLDALIASRDGNTTTRPYINAPLDYITFGMDANQLDMVNTYRIGKESLCNIYDFPVHLITAENATDNNYNSAIKYLLTNTIYAMLCGYRDMVNQWLLPMMGEAGMYYDFDLTEMPELQDDIERLAKWMQATWAITPNELREALKYEKIENPLFDEPFVPNNVQPLSMIDAVDMSMPNTGDYNTQRDNGQEER